MTTLADRPNAALLVIDVQNDVVARAHDRDGVVGRIAGLVEAARSAGTPVVWVQHSDPDLPRDSDGWRYVPELVRLEPEPLIHKAYGDAFEGTELEAVLAARVIGRVVVVGAQTDACIRSTLHGAFVRGYDVTLVTDAHTTCGRGPGMPTAEQVIAHTNGYWQYQSAPGRRAEAIGAAQVLFGEAGHRA